MLTLISMLLAASSLDQNVELQLIPITGQINTLHSEHLGTGGRLSIRLNQYFGGYFAGVGHWHNAPSSEKDELSERSVRIDLYQPLQLSSVWQATMGLESIPLSGRFRFMDLHEGDFGLVVRAGLGMGGVRIRLKPPTMTREGVMSPATFGDAGVRLLGDFGAAFRFGIGAFAIHLGPRLSMWSDEIKTINGCDLSDLRAMDMAIRAGADPSVAAVSPQCTGFAKVNDVALAMSVARAGRIGPLVVNVAAELGVSWAF